eukprot:gene14180-19028_t
MLFSLISVIVLALSVTSYHILPSTQKWQPAKNHHVLSMSDIPIITPQVLEKSAKEALKGGCSGLSRAEVNEYVVELEKKNPTTNPANSSLVNGVWEVIYASGLGSPGMFGFQVIKSLPISSVIDLSDLTITITSTQPRVTASTTLNLVGVKVDLSVISSLEEVSSLRLKESYVTGRFGTVDIPLNSSIKTYSREIIVTYVDDELLIVRDPIGAPEILKRKPMVFQGSSLEGQPGATDVDGKPGV